MKPFFMAIAAAALTASAAAAEFSGLNTIMRTFEFNGQTTTISFDPKAATTEDQGFIQVAIQTRIDAHDLQQDLVTLMNRQWAHDACGHFFKTHGAHIRPDGSGLRIGFTAQAKLWECADTKALHTAFEMTCVLRMFGDCLLQTKVPVVRWHRDVEKTKLTSQAVRAEVMVAPVFENGSVLADVEVVEPAPKGLAAELVATYDVYHMVQDRVQQTMTKKVWDHSSAFPADITTYNPLIESVRFVDLGGGRLGIAVSVTGLLPPEHVATLLTAQLY